LFVFDLAFIIVFAHREITLCNFSWNFKKELFYKQASESAILYQKEHSIWFVVLSQFHPKKAMIQPLCGCALILNIQGAIDHSFLENYN
jgi:hypothetical protein